MQADSPLRQVGKRRHAALVGIAVDRGFLVDVEETNWPYLSLSDGGNDPIRPGVLNQA